MTHDTRPTVTLKRGDTRPTFRDILADEPQYNDPIDLTEYDSPEVRLYMEHVASGKLMVNDVATIVNPNDGIVEYTFTPSETSLPGEHIAEWVVEDTSGNAVHTIPQDTYRVVDVTEPLSREATVEEVDRDITVTTVHTDELSSNTRSFVRLRSSLRDVNNKLIYDIDDGIPTNALADDVVPAVESNGSVVVDDVGAINFADGLDVTNDGDNSVTIDALATTTGITVEDSGVQVATGVSTVSFGPRLNVTDMGGGEVSVTAPLAGHTVSDDGSQVLNDAPSDVNYGNNLSVQNDGDGTVTVDALGGGDVDSEVTRAALVTDPTNSSQAISPNTQTEISFDAVRFDSGNLADPAANEISIPEDGTYWLAHRVGWRGTMADTTRLTSVPTVNGSNIELNSEITAAASEFHTTGHAGPVDLTAGDKVSMYVLHNNGTSVDVKSSAMTYLAVVKIDGATGGGGGGGRPIDEAPNLHIPYSELDTGQSIKQPVAVPAGQTLTVHAWGAVDSNGNTPSGLYTRMITPSGNTSQANVKWSAVSGGIASYENTSGGIEIVELALANETGTNYSDPNAVSARFAYEVS